MRNMSFMLTTPQMYARTKDVTRRIGWWNLKPGDVVMAVEKGRGLKKGEKVKRIYPIRILSVTAQELATDLTVYEVKREGFPEMTIRQFLDMFCASHKCSYFAKVNRIEFEEVKDTHAAP